MIARACVLLTLALALGCGHDAATNNDRAPTSSGLATATDPAKTDNGMEVEQERFDRERRPDLIVAALDVKPGAVVADVGAGSGLLTVHVAKAVSPGGKVIATDIDSSVLDLMGARLRAAGVDAVVERRTVAADDPGLAPDTFDVILLAEVDHYLADRTKWLKTAMQQLRPGGRIVITNRVYHRAETMAGALGAGLKLKSETNPVPSHFIAVFVR